jgi:hypothetical protein
MMELLINSGADIGVKMSDNEELWENFLRKGIYEYAHLFINLISFNKHPQALFAFSSLIYQKKMRELCFRIIENDAPNIELMNSCDAEGFTPLLKYLRTFVEEGPHLFDKIQKYVRTEFKKVKKIQKSNIRMFVDSYDITITDEMLQNPLQLIEAVYL